MVDLTAHADDAHLGTGAETVARLTDCDVVLIYEAATDDSGQRLVAQWGLQPAQRPRFGRLEHRAGGGGFEPLTPQLLDIGIRAWLGHPVWVGDALAGHIFFGSRRAGQFHEDDEAVFVATAAHVSLALESRKNATAADAPSWRQPPATSADGGRNQFIAVLAHELRNPIAPIRSGLDLITTGLLDEEGRRHTAEMMQRQLAHLVRLIDDLLDSVRLDTGQLQAKREPVPIGDVVRAAIESIRPALCAKRQALDLLEAGDDVVVDADPVRLAQAFVNILAANVEQTPERGVVAVKVIARASDLTVSFEDQGVCLSPQELEHALELFPRSAERKSDEGWGIGLALVRGLVELNEGRIDVRNRAAGAGLVYTVTLPRTVLPVDDASRPVGATTPLQWPSHRILVVDDNRDAAETLGLLLELDGHTVRLAHDGPAAVSQAKEFQPEIILLDIGLPGFSGTEAARRIRALDGAVKPFIIALTGWGGATDREVTLAAGCDVHLVKPISHEAVRETILTLTGARPD